MLLFPSSAEDGSIEAVFQFLRQRLHLLFPSSAEDGSIEATATRR